MWLLMLIYTLSHVIAKSFSTLVVVYTGLTFHSMTLNVSSVFKDVWVSIWNYSILGRRRVSRIVGYATIASGSRTEISVRVPEMLHYGIERCLSHKTALLKTVLNSSVINCLSIRFCQLNKNKHDISVFLIFNFIIKAYPKDIMYETPYGNHGLRISGRVSGRVWLRVFGLQNTRLSPTPNCRGWFIKELP